MDDKELNELIVVKQLPKIAQQLQLISDEIDKEIEIALALDYTEDSKTEVKKARARLNNINKVLDKKRMEVKEAILKPYNEFLEIYDNLVKSKLNEADSILKTRVEIIESEQLNNKTEKLKIFAEEYFKKYNIPSYITFSDICLNITLSASEKSLKEQIVNFCEKINKDLQLIRLEENGIEIENEYSINGFDYAKAKLTVIDRHKKLEELAKVKQELDSKKEQEEKIVEQVEEIIAPVELEEQLNEDIKFDERLECTFTVWATKEELKKIRKKLMEMGLKFQ